MKPGFKILFAVDTIHDYFKNGVCTHFRFVPSKETAALLANCGAMYKSVGNKLLVVIKADENNKPAKIPAASDRFVFFMELMQPVFMNISAPDFGEKGIQRFYFTNLQQNKFSFSAGDDIFYLSEPLKAYDSNTAYEKGAMVIDNNTTFECVVNAAKDETPTAKPDNWVKRLKHPSAILKFSPYDKERVYEKDEIVNEDAIIYKCLKHTEKNNRPAVSAEFWKPIVNNQFATNSDLLRITPSQFAYTLPPAGAAQIKIEALALNTVNNKFETVVFNQVQSFEKPVQAVSIDLSKLKDGKYKLLINNKEEWIYVSNMAVYNNYFGVIELFNHLPDGNSFSFYKAGGILKDEKNGDKNLWLNYTIRFANRLAFVKYIVPQKGVELIDTEPGTGMFTGLAGASAFTSKQRLPLQETSNEFKLKLKTKITADSTFPAPNPDINAPGMMTKDDTDYYCNIYLNY